ncbi:MAG: DNA-3-methyladenine glycosylase [Acidobacteriota bacterium]|jgi:DNA-3-methyladenine glycosylase II|nr:DNA-3-methyladenine glycosylase [Acidobacteriota bacterium]
MSSKAAARAQSRPPKRLSAASLARGVQLLSEIDPDLARIPRTHGAPQMWEREPGFPTLVLTILEQQVSLASARAAFERLLAAAAPLTPRTLLAFDDAALRGFGFSRQKISYSRLAAHAVESGELDFDALAALDDDAARAALTRLKGVGPWTAEIYLLRALGRPDAWPAGDLALQLAAQEVKRLSTRPTAAELESLAEPWRPWRAVAARMLWQHYLHRPKRATPTA